MSGFKDMVERDIYGVFLELDEFADWHTVAGKRIRCVFDDDLLEQRASSDQGSEYGAANADLLVFAKTTDLPCRQTPGQTINVDNRQFVILDWKENMGVAELTLQQAQVY